MSVNWTAAEGFGRAAAAYERGRPGYPQAAIDWMVDQLGITPASTVIDLGAGTGKFSRMMRWTGARVIAIEPVAAMRVELANAVPGVSRLDRCGSRHIGSTTMWMKRNWKRSWRPP